MKNEFYIDMISKSIISSLSNEIAGNTNSYIKEFLEKEFSGLITDKIKAEVQLMAKQISGIEKNTIQQAERSAKEIKGQVGKVIEKHLAGYAAEIDASIKEMKKELSETGEIKEIVEASGQELKEHISEMKNELSLAGETRAIVEASGQEIKDQISEMAKALDANSGQDAMFKDELDSLKQVFLKISTEQNDILKGAVENSMAGHTAAIDDSIKDMKKELSVAGETRAIVESSGQEIKKHISEMAKVLNENNDQDTMFKDELNGLKQTLIENKKEDKELLNGVFYSVKKLLADNGREKSLTQFEIALGDIKNQIKENMEKRLRIESTSQDKIAGEFHDGINDLKKHIDIKIEKSLKEYGQKDAVQKELTAINKAMNEKDKVLNGMVLSVKKLTSAHTKDKEGSENMMAQFQVILDALKRHVRLLEADKDELSVELLRLAGDEFFQSKFAELEKKLEKTKSLADKYLGEKIELTSKLQAFQHLWEQAAENKAK